MKNNEKNNNDIIDEEMKNSNNNVTNNEEEEVNNINNVILKEEPPSKRKWEEIFIEESVKLTSFLVKIEKANNKDPIIFNKSREEFSILMMGWFNMIDNQREYTPSQKKEEETDFQKFFSEQVDKACKTGKTSLVIESLAKIKPFKVNDVNIETVRSQLCTYTKAKTSVDKKHYKSKEQLWYENINDEKMARVIRQLLSRKNKNARGMTKLTYRNCLLWSKKDNGFGLTLVLKMIHEGFADGTPLAKLLVRDRVIVLTKKNSSKPRVIQIGEVLILLLSALIVKNAQTSIKAKLNEDEDHGYADKYSIQKMQIQCQALFKQGKILLKCDITKCFPSLKASMTYQQLLTVDPDLARHVKQWFVNESHTLWYTAKEFSFDFTLDDVLLQGNPAIPAICEYVISVILQKARKKHKMNIPHFLDDFVLSGTFRQVAMALKEINDELKKIELTMSPEKFEILQELKGDKIEDEEGKQMLMNELKEVGMKNIEIKNDGMEITGLSVGTDEYITKFCEKKIEEVNEILQEIRKQSERTVIETNHMQTLTNILIHTIPQKLMHLMTCGRVEIINPIIKKMDEKIFITLLSTLKCEKQFRELNKEEQSMIAKKYKLPKSEGGMGVLLLQRMQVKAILTLALNVQNIVNKASTNGVCPFLEILESAITRAEDYQLKDDDLELIQEIQANLIQGKKQTMTKSKIDEIFKMYYTKGDKETLDDEERDELKETTGPVVASYLQADQYGGNKINNTAFRFATMRLLGLPIFKRDYKCVCGKILDKNGYHVHTIKHVHATSRHNTFRDVLAELLKELLGNNKELTVLWEPKIISAISTNFKVKEKVRERYEKAKLTKPNAESPYLKRADLGVYDTSSGTTLMMDVMVPLMIDKRFKDHKRGMRVGHGESIKNKVYNGRFDFEKKDFCPVILTPGGAINEQFQETIQKLVERVEKDKGKRVTRIAKIFTALSVARVRIMGGEFVTYMHKNVQLIKNLKITDNLGVEAQRE